MNIEAKNKAKISLKKTISLLSRIEKMVTDDVYCIDIMQQNLAAIGLLKSLHRQLMENHLTHCFKSGIEAKNEKKILAMIDEIIKVSTIANK